MGIIKEAFKNSVGGIANSVAGGVGGALGSSLSYGIGELTGLNDKLKEDQREQQEFMTNLQYGANLGLMKESYKQQKELWDATNAEAQVKHLKNAGLNPALIYGGGSGSGGSTGGGGSSVSGGNSSDEASRAAVETSRMMAGLAMMKTKSEIAVNESIAQKNVAESKTTDESRNLLVEKLKQEGKSTWLDNIRQRYLMGETDATYRNKQYGEANVSIGSLFDKQNTAIVTKALADTNNANAQALLTNEKAQGYWQELLNETVKADSTAIQAASTKLAAEWQTGEFTNWKTWADLARGVTKDILGTFIK